VASRIEYSFNLVLFFSFDKFWRRFMEVHSMFRCFSIWSEQGRVKDIVKGPVRGELEAINDGRDLLEYPERTISFWC
jgi:hypothetical protein